MRIRTVTVAFTPSTDSDRELELEFAAAKSALEACRRALEERGWEVQTTRCVLDSRTIFTGSTAEVLTRLSRIATIVQKESLHFVSLGSARARDHVEAVPQFLEMSPSFNCSVKVDTTSSEVEYRTAAQAMVQAYKRNGLSGCFRFCVCSGNCEGIAYFPAADHSGPAKILVGFENGDVVLDTAKKIAEESGTRDTEAFSESLSVALTSSLDEVQSTLVEALAKNNGSSSLNVSFGGFDLSVAPSVEKKGSIGGAVETLMGLQFGRPGTLSGCEAITRALKKIREKGEYPIVGYSGLMLPVCEDTVLAQRAAEGCYDVQKLLSFSAVCGCGLDTVAVAVKDKGDIDAISFILRDMASLAFRCQKPLSCRFLISEDDAGSVTAFDSPYLVNSALLRL